MAVRFQAYTSDGVIQAHLAGEGRLGARLEAGQPFTVELGQVGWLDGSPALTFTRTEVDPDELIVVVAPPEQVVPSHAVWHELELAAGPWAIRGRLPTLPGFDPGRALARPGGTFVVLAGVVAAEAARAGLPSGGGPGHPFAYINRYTVERVVADIDLGYFFPGAATSIRKDPD